MSIKDKLNYVKEKAHKSSIKMRQEELRSLRDSVDFRIAELTEKEKNIGLFNQDEDQN